jgi:SWI/SNF-related matrix-associated actin-dependent regulator 1 of chromatin subfamily A
MRRFVYTEQVPPEAIAIPGVWKNKRGNGFRVPHNVHSLLGWAPSTLNTVSDEILHEALTCPKLIPGLDTFAKPHQKEMIRKMLALPGSHGWAPPGAGKTLTALVVMANTSGPRLVVTKAAARGTWVEQIRRYTKFEPVLLLGQKPPLGFELSKEVIYITAWETIKYWADTLSKHVRITVWDEIHWLRRPKHCKAIVRTDGSVKFEGLGNSLDAARKIAQASDRSIGLTATPIPGRVKDLWTQLDLVEPWQWGTFHNFGVRYCGGEHTGYGYQYNGLTNADELRERLSFVKVRVAREDVNQHLPPKRREIIRLSVQEQNKPAAMKREIKRAATSGDKESYFETLMMEAASRKHTYIQDRVVDCLRADQKVVVFTGRRLDCERLADKLEKFCLARVPRAQIWWAHGGTDPAERDHIRNEYMASPGPSLLVGTGDAWGESIDLQDTDLAIIAMLPWTPDKVIQWEGRFARLGQTRPVLVSYIIARATADEHVADLLLDKLPHVGEIAEDTAAQEIEEAIAGVDNSPEARASLLARIIETPTFPEHSP